MINKGNIKGDLGFGRGDLEAMYGLMILNDKNCDENLMDGIEAMIILDGL